MLNLEIITCPQWDALPPVQEPIWTDGKSSKIIFHHTAGHHPEISLPGDESREEAIKYAQNIQKFHMFSNGWNDSGHNFLVCRNGVVLQGRWRTVRAIQAKRMVVSAHCRTQNDQIGVEHEHLGNEPMTIAQRLSSAKLNAWIAINYEMTIPLPMFPHSKFNSTSCPANLISEIPAITSLARQFLLA